MMIQRAKEYNYVFFIIINIKLFDIGWLLNYMTVRSICIFPVTFGFFSCWIIINIIINFFLLLLYEV